MKELTENQKKLIEDYINHHDGYKQMRALIYRILKYTPVGCDMDDWIGVAHIGLVKAARNFKPGKCNFSTFAHLNISSAIKQTLTFQNRDKRGGSTVTVSLDAPVCEELTLEDVVADEKSENMFDNIIEEFLSYFNDKEQIVLRYLIDGYSRTEICQFTGCNVRYIETLLNYKCKTPEVISIKNRIIERKKGYRSYDQA